MVSCIVTRGHCNAKITAYRTFENCHIGFLYASCLDYDYDLLSRGGGGGGGGGGGSRL